MSAVAIIPARWASTRFPGKPLFPISGKPLIQYVWERCLKAKTLSRVIIATEDMRIAEAAFDFGAEVSLTSPKHPSGTDRVAEVAAKLHGSPYIINVQGDEPTLEPRLIDQLVRTLQRDPKLKMVTAASRFETKPDALNPNNVKVVTALDGRALYFSRSLIPFDRDDSQLSTLRVSRDVVPAAVSPVPRQRGQATTRGFTSCFQPLWHVGIYGYRRDFVMQFVRWRPTPLERSEKLEQLRALEHGATIRVVQTRHRALGVDTPDDVPRAEAALALQRRHA
jgi:3-deoxy-manno-octulosonate cytidylyltransferase (CMP-KDO synthetase)